ncbi:MAG: cytochrome c oxidase subunit II [Pseudomonadales bacterium]
MSLDLFRSRFSVHKALAAASLMSTSMFTAAGANVESAERWGTNMTQGVTEISRGIYDLHMLIFWICVVIGVLVFGVMFYSMIVHRHSKGYKPSTFHESTKVEILWTVLPAFILIFMGWEASKMLITMYDEAEDAEVSIMVTGYQWKWKYEYMDEGVAYFSNLTTSQGEINNIEPKGEHYLLEVDNPIVIPTNKKVRFLITANDVIHAWWVPALAVKQDAIPGFINTAWAIAEEEGIYRGQCAELCGRDHGFMPIVLRAVSPGEFDSWLGERKAEAVALNELIKQEMSFDQLMDTGKDVYTKQCVVCHGASGEGGVGKALAGSGTVPTGPMDQHLSIMVNGVPGTAMQAFGAQLNEIDLAAVVTYARNSWGNNMGDSIQPVDVYNFKQSN